MSRLRKVKVEEPIEIKPVEEVPRPVEEIPAPPITDNTERIQKIQDKYRSMGEYLNIKQDASEQELRDLEIKAEMRMANSVNQGITSMALKSYSMLCSPVCDEEKLYESLNKDEILKNSMTQMFTYYLSSFGPMASMGLLTLMHTVGNINTQKIKSLSNNVTKPSEAAIQTDNQGEIGSGEDDPVDQHAGQY